MQRDLIKGDVGLLRRRGDADKPRWLLGLDERFLALRGFPVRGWKEAAPAPAGLGLGLDADGFNCRLSQVWGSGNLRCEFWCNSWIVWMPAEEGKDSVEVMACSKPRGK